MCVSVCERECVSLNREDMFPGGGRRMKVSREGERVRRYRRSRNRKGKS